VRRAPLADLRSVAAAGAALCGVAAAFAASALYVPGIALLLLSVLAPAWVWLASARARVELEPVVASAYEGERIAVPIQVRRGLSRYGPAELLVGGLTVPLPPRRPRARVAVSALAERRGPQEVGPARLRISDPLGICARELRSQAPEVLVLPRVYPVSAGVLSRLHRGAAPARRGDVQLHLDSLRRYDASGPASRIHWPTVARTGELMARAFVAEAESRVLVVVDARVPASEEALDRALRAAASLCVHLARSGGCELLLPGEARPHPIGAALEYWPALHVRLALVRAGTQTASSAWRGLARSIVYVTAAREPDRGAARAGAYWRVGPHPLPGLELAFDVAGCSAQLIEEAALRVAA
jgi:uncharacterized protein (DUF58 family)